MCDKWSVLQPFLTWLNGSNTQVKTIITSEYFVRQLMVPGNYLDIRIVKLCHLLIIITHTCNLTSYTKKSKCLRQYIGQYSVNADQSCMLSSQINPDSTRAKHRFEWYGNYLNDSYRQYNTYTDVWGGFWPIK